MADKYDDYSREDLIRLIRERDRKPRFGLLWERDEIDHDRSVNSDFVTLEVDPDLSCGDGSHPNLVIEGDNFDALRYLRMTHAGQINCIYIDPPYNTGNKDFIYNDTFVDRDDAYRHSKWLEFMYRRLELAKDLLTEDGVIFVSIDDNEVFHLGLLMEQVFGPNNFIANVIWQKVYSPKNTAQHFSDDHEYVICFALNKNVWRPNPVPRSEAQDKAYKNPDNDPRGVWKASDLSARNPYSLGIYSVTCPSGRIIPAPPTGRYWTISKDKFDDFDSDNRIWWGKDGNNVPALKRFLSEVKQGVVPQTLWKYEEVGHTQDAKKEINDILQFKNTADVFTTPKPIRLIERILRVATKPGDIVLDFFAGSGTTAHAVLKLNQEDAGNRRFILVSSTEATEADPTKNLCRDICAERVRRAINGYINKKEEQVEGLPGSFAYMRTRRIPSEKVFSKIQHEQIWTAIQLIHTGSVSAYSKKETVQKASTERGIVLYVPKISESIVERLLTEIQHVGQATIYSWQPALLEQRIEDARVSFEPIPQYLVNRFGAGAKR